MKISSVLFSALLAGFIGTLAHAETTTSPSGTLSIAASTCVVDEVSAALAEQHGATLTFRKDPAHGDNGKAKAAEIVARCSVANPNGINWDSLLTGYVDPDGAGTNTQVLVDLIRLDPSTTVAESIASFDSNRDGGSTEANGQSAANTAFFHNWPNDGAAYYLELRLRKAGSEYKLRPSILSVGLTSGGQAGPLQPATALSCPVGQCSHGVKVNGQCSYYCSPSCPSTSC